MSLSSLECTIGRSSSPGFLGIFDGMLAEGHGTHMNSGVKTLKRGRIVRPTGPRFLGIFYVVSEEGHGNSSELRG